MARTKGMLNLSGNLEVNAGAPLDARTVVPTLADLTVASNFQYKYVGMTVTVQATGDMYTLLSNDVTDIANWKPVGKTYTAGTNVNISDQNVISATDTTYTAGTGIDITNGVISATGGGGSSYTAGDGIVIENDEISTDNMPAADMAEIVTPLPSVMSRLHTYSEDEQIVAYWEETVNSVKSRKPVYEKVIVTASQVEIPNGSWATIYTNSNLNIERCIDFSLMSTNLGNYSCVGYLKYETNAVKMYGLARSLTLPAGSKCIIHYTKTTDQWIPV